MSNPTLPEPDMDKIEIPRTDALAGWKWIPGQHAGVQMDKHYADMKALARTLERELVSAQERIADLEGALKLLMNMEVKGHSLQDRLQFTVTGRAYLDKARNALKGES